MKNLKALSKFARVQYYILRFMAEASARQLRERDLWRLRGSWLPMISRYNRIGLEIMGIEVRMKGDFGRPQGKGRLLVGNHLSYLDILIVGAKNPASFVTSQEIREMPGLGWICTLAGCVFVERRNKSNIHKEIGEITEALNRGLDVVVFPEATSTNGESVLRFRKALFTAAIDAGAEVVPYCVNYRLADGHPIDLANRDHFCWYGDMSFAPHLMKFLSYERVDVGIDVLPSISARDFSDPAALANLCHERVSAAFEPFHLRGANRQEPSLLEKVPEEGLGAGN